MQDAVRTAIRLGYRHFDCAMVYQNEQKIGEVFDEVLSRGILDRDELFISDKVILILFI